MTRTKQIILFALCIGSFGMTDMQAQPNPNCIGLKNPTNFTLSGSHNEKWTGYTGTKLNLSSNCLGQEGGDYSASSGGLVIQAASLEHSSHNPSASACSISLDNGQTRSTSRDIHNDLDHSYNFVIKGPGTDPETYGHLSYLPPDTSFHSSIRLGNYCGYAGAEKLTYELRIQPENAMITIWFALSLQNGQHSASENPEFVIMVEKNIGTTANPNWQPLAHDTLCYIRPTPVDYNPDTAFRVGATGAVLTSNPNSLYGDNLYLPWRKVMINLVKYIGQTIRIRMTAGDCSMSAHYAMAYIAGDCQSKDLTTSGCAAGETSAVTTVKAPKGAISYAWYRSKYGKLNGTEVQNMNNYQLIAGAEDDSLNVTLDHFTNVNTGATEPQSTIMCRMTTKMNDTKSVTTDLPIDVGNTKPMLVVDSALDCDAGITMWDYSFAPYTMNNPENYVDTNLTQWEFYTSYPPTEQSLDGSYTGGHATHTFTQAGTNYSVKVRSSASNTTCWNEKTIKIRTIKAPRPSLRLHRDSLCEGDTVIVFNQTPGSAYNEWTFISGSDTVRRTNTIPSNSFRVDSSAIIYVHTRNNIHYMADTNTDGVMEPIYCFADTSIEVHVDEYPVLIVTGDTIVCNGTQAMNSNNPLQNNTSTLTTMPTHDIRYYVKATSPFNCRSWDSINIYIVDPVLEVPITKMCENDHVKLIASNAYSYTWTSMPDDPSLAGQTSNDTIIVSPHNTTTYSVVGHGMNNCSATPLTQTITVFHHPVPTFEMNPKFVDSEEPVVTFRDVSPESTFTEWNFGNGNVSNEKQIRYTFTDLSEDSILVKLTTGSGNELQSISDTAFYIPVELFAVWFPNAFTPDESTNREFFMFTHNELEYFSFYLYDRRGGQILYTTDQNFKWDGTYKGKPCPNGVYVYTCTYRRPGTTDIVTRRGTVTLLR